MGALLGERGEREGAGGRGRRGRRGRLGEAAVARLGLGAAAEVGHALAHDVLLGPTVLAHKARAARAAREAAERRGAVLLLRVGVQREQPR